MAPVLTSSFPRARFLVARSSSASRCCTTDCAAAFSLSRCASVLLRRLHGAFRHREFRLGFPELGLERLGVHVGDDLTGGDEVPFVHQFVDDAAGELRGDVDLRRLDAPVAAGESVRQLLGLGRLSTGGRRGPRSRRAPCRAAIFERSSPILVLARPDRDFSAVGTAACSSRPARGGWDLPGWRIRPLNALIGSRRLLIDFSRRRHGDTPKGCAIDVVLSSMRMKKAPARDGSRDGAAIAIRVRPSRTNLHSS